MIITIFAFAILAGMIWLGFDFWKTSDAETKQTIKSFAYSFSLAAVIAFWFLVVFVLVF